MPEINCLAALAAALWSFVVGGVWYSAALFGKAWQRAAGVTDEQLKTGNPAKIYGGALVLFIIAAVVFALFLVNGGYHTVQFTMYGLVLGLWH